MSERVALVTGAASGLGAAVAGRLQKDGYDVVGLDLETPEPWIEQGDVRVEADVARVVGSAATRGPLTAMVLSAAVETRASIVDTSDDEWQRIIDTNLKGPFLCMKHAVPHMVAGGGGSIVAMGSTLGAIVAPQYPAYCASKFGLTNLCKQVAIEHAPDNVRVNVLSLGPTDSGLFVRLTDMAPDPEAVRAGVAANLPMKRLGRASEVCDAVSFLLSDASGWTSGAVLPLDGGLAARRQ